MATSVPQEFFSNEMRREGRVVDIMALHGRFPRGLADEGSPDPLDLDGVRPARAVSRTVPDGPRRALDLGVLR